MKITADYKVTEKRTQEFDVDSRICNDELMTYRVADIILDGRLQNLRNDLYEDDNLYVVERAVHIINEAFSKADTILALIESENNGS